MFYTLKYIISTIHMSDRQVGILVVINSEIFLVYNISSRVNRIEIEYWYCGIWFGTGMEQYTVIQEY